MLLQTKSRGRGIAPPLPRGDFYVCNRREFSPHQSPAVTASPQGEAFGAGCPIGRPYRKAARRGRCARRRVSERNRRTAAALSAEIDPSLRTTGRLSGHRENRLFPVGL